MKKSVLAVAVATVSLMGCGTANNYLSAKTKTVEYYRIYQIKTDAPRQVVAAAASNGLGRNVNNAQEATPIPSSAELPEKPGRFKLVNPLEGSQLGALALFSGGGAGSLGFRVATCDGAVWTAKAQRSVAGSNNLSITTCLWQYKDGYHLDQYAVFTKQEGGLFQVSRDAANALVGTPEEWTEKTLLDVVRQIKLSTKADIAMLESQPELAGTPWLDKHDAMIK
jgi:hypothetical protein